jgi:hypothetical protein
MIQSKEVKMQIPNRTFSTNLLLELGRFHLAAVQQSVETQPLAAGFQLVYDALLAAKQARDNADMALVLPRVAFIFSEWALEQTLRELAYAAHAADGSAAGGARREVRARYQRSRQTQAGGHRYGWALSCSRVKNYQF